MRTLEVIVHVQSYLALVSISQNPHERSYLLHILHR